MMARIGQQGKYTNFNQFQEDKTGQISEEMERKIGFPVQEEKASESYLFEITSVTP